MNTKTNPAKEKTLEFTHLILKHRWLEPRLQEFSSLFFDDCQTDEERSLLVELIERFRYVSSDVISESISKLALEIATTPNLVPQNTIIAAMAADSSPDSSQLLVQLLKVKLQKLEWETAKVVNRFAQAFNASKESQFVRNNIVLVDEFVGSGQTVSNRVKTILSQFEGKDVRPTIRVRSIFASVVGRERLLDEGLDFECVEQVRRGISDFVDGDRDEKIAMMLRLEGRLAGSHNELKLEDYSLGYGKTECLIGMEDFNIPNNVFPVFWWPRYLDGARRAPLFIRWMGN